MEFSSSAFAIGQEQSGQSRWIVADDIRGNLELLRMLIDAGIRRLTNAFFNLIRRVHPLHLGSTSCLIDPPSTLGNSRPTSRSMPETQNFDPVGFKRVHDNYRTFDKCAKIGSFSNTMSRFGINPLRSRPTNRSAAKGIFSDKIADFDKVRFCREVNSISNRTSPPGVS